jgi:hypothetical protein
MKCCGVKGEVLDALGDDSGEGGKRGYANVTLGAGKKRPGGGRAKLGSSVERNALTRDESCAGRHRARLAQISFRVYT